MLTIVTVLLVIVTLLLAIITGFYTFNLSRISVFDKRYKIYESLIKLIKVIQEFKEVKLLNFVLDIPKDRKVLLIDFYKSFYGDTYNNFVFNIESVRFLFNEELYVFLVTFEKQATNVKDYAYDYLNENFMDNLDRDEKEKKCAEAIKYFLSLNLEHDVVKKLSPYLEFEENIAKYFFTLCKKCCCKIRKS